MNEQTTEGPSLTRKITDTALIIIAVAAVASWLWRRVRRSTTDESPESSALPEIDDKVGAAAGYPSNSPTA